MKRVIHTRGFTHRHLHWLFGGIAVVLLSLAPAAQAATLTHKYTFGTDYSDSEGGLDITPVYGFVSGGRHILGNFDPLKPNNGLTLTNGLSNTSDYSIVLVFEFDAPSEGTNTFKKIIDFQGLTTDEGLYTSGYTLYFYGATFPSGTPLTPEEDAHLVLTRDSSTKLVTFYLDGVEQGSFTDNSELAIPSGNVLTFFEDDDVSRNTYPEYHSGSVDDIEIYDGALSSTEVAGLYRQWIGKPAPVVKPIGFAKQAVDYSDEISTVGITVTDEDDSCSDLMTLDVSNDPAHSNLNLTQVNCSPHPNEDSPGSMRTYNYTGQVLDPGYKTYPITFTPSDSVGPGTPGTHELTINAEEAEVTLDSDNDISAKVENPGGDDAVFSLFFAGWEFLPDDATEGGAKPGDLNKMSGFMELQPVGPGSTVTVACSFIDPLPAGSPNLSYDEEALFQCDFTDVPVNTYTVVAEVWGENLFAGTVEEQWKDVYYYGSDEDVFTVFDPSLGFTSGGGWFYWPETAVDSCLEYDSEEPFDCLVENEGPCSGYPGDKTSFGFNLKYNKKKNSAKGSLLLMRHTVDENCEYAGSYRLKSNAIEAMSLGEDADDNGTFGWAAASGKAVYREPDLVDEGNYTFVMYVEDHGEQGCGQDPADVFRIVVRDKDGNGVDDLSVDLEGDEGGEGGQIECGNILVPHKTGKKGDGDGGGGPKEPNPNKGRKG